MNFNILNLEILTIVMINIYYLHLYDITMALNNQMFNMHLCRSSNNENRKKCFQSNFFS